MWVHLHPAHLLGCVAGVRTQAPHCSPARLSSPALSSLVFATASPQSHRPAGSPGWTPLPLWPAAPAVSAAWRRSSLSPVGLRRLFVPPRESHLSQLLPPNPKCMHAPGKRVTLQAVNLQGHLDHARQQAQMSPCCPFGSPLPLHCSCWQCLSAPQGRAASGHPSLHAVSSSPPLSTFPNLSCSPLLAGELSLFPKEDKKLEQMSWLRSRVPRLGKGWGFCPGPAT